MGSDWKGGERGGRRDVKQWRRGDESEGVRRAAERQESIPSEGPKIGAVECNNATF